MQSLIPFMNEHPFISLFMFYLACQTTLKTITIPVLRIFRHLDIKRNGWPPANCDADGDSKPKNKEDTTN